MKPVSQQDRTLAVELAVSLSSWLKSHLDVVTWRELDESTPAVYNMGLSSHEAGCQALNAVGVFEQADHYTTHYVRVSPVDVRQHMEQLQSLSSDKLALLLDAFIGGPVAHSALLPTHREAFQVPNSLEGLARRLTDSGYLDADGNGKRWTDKITSFMHKWSVWTDGRAPLSATPDGVEVFCAGLSAADRDRLLETYRGNGYIAALQLLRSIAGLELKFAKDVLDFLVR
ncbi:hypothetical protein [uncultured Jannaschia sp.]|uniref:hypothetical protein n=1 Tax=uncultured Jannaschia sp. TaxID=293347 RepID=UPI002621C9DD|nr:hypothetical protein [uncultured Jannaschia sp.]